MMLYGSLQIKKNIFYLFSAMIFVIVMTGCFEKQEAKGPTSTSSTATPTPVPTPFVDTDLGLEIYLNDALQKYQFLSNENIACYGSSDKHPDKENIIEWKVEGLKNDSNTGVPNCASGEAFIFMPAPIPISNAKEGRGPLAYEIETKLTIGNKTDYEYIRIEQDNIHDLMQEYIDVYTVRNVIDGTIPALAEFDQTNPENVNEALARLVNQPSSVCARHQYWIVSDLADKVEAIYQDVYNYIGPSLNVTCGYRCPSGNARVGGAKKSQHLYGTAFDWAQNDSEDNFDIARIIIEEHSPSRVYLYDSNETIYSDIPKNYEDRNPSDVIYTHGHVDWRN